MSLYLPEASGAIVSDGPAMWSKSHPSWGRNRRIQRNYYAYLVAMVMTGGRMECPTCGKPFDLCSNESEVDKAIPALDYRPGNITTICHACNHSRGLLQSHGGDWPRVEDYVRDVRLASRDVAIPRVCDARAWWIETHNDGEGWTSRYA